LRHGRGISCHGRDDGRDDGRGRGGCCWWRGWWVRGKFDSCIGKVGLIKHDMSSDKNMTRGGIKTTIAFMIAR
jgi:hypothetical protein